MQFPFSYPKSGPGLLAWRTQLLLRPLRSLFDRMTPELGMPSPPTLLSLFGDQNTAEMSPQGLWLLFAGQKHLVWPSEPSGTTPVWFADGASAYWQAGVHALLWLPKQVQTPHWLQAKELFLRWDASAEGWASGKDAKIVYSPDVVGQRLLSLLAVLAKVEPDQDLALYKKIRRRAMLDAAFLSRVGAGGQSGWSRLSALEGLCVFGASFDGLDGWQAKLLPELYKVAFEQFEGNGAHESGDVSVTAHSYVSLSNAHSCLGRMRNLDAKQMEMLKAIKSLLVATAQSLSSALVGPDPRLAAFSGFVRPSGDALLKILKRTGDATKAESYVPGMPWTRVQTSTRDHTGQINALAVCAYNYIPPRVRIHGQIAFHAGQGAIEIASEHGPLIGGCGIGHDLTRWGGSLRGTQAFSTLTLPGLDALPVLASAKGNRARLSSDAQANLSQHRVGDVRVLELSHNLFQLNDQVIQLSRRIRLSEDASRIDGEDRLEFPPNGSKGPSVATRFQFATGLQVHQETKTRVILTQAKIGSGVVRWALVLTSGSLTLEPGMWFDEFGKPRSAPNLAITAPVQDGRCLIFWRLERLSPDDAEQQDSQQYPTTLDQEQEA